MSDLARVQTAFTQAILHSGVPVPSCVHGAERERAGRRFSVYRNDVMAGLVSALRTRFPVVEQLVGPEFFKALARDYVAEEPPRSPVLLYYGDTFPLFIDGFAPAAPIPYLGDVARIELARELAYDAADVTPVDGAAFAALPRGRLGELRMRLHPSISIVTSRYPAFSIWRVNQNLDRVVPVSPWAPEAALIARPFLTVETRQVSDGMARFIRKLADDATLAEALDAGMAASEKFDVSEAFALLIATDIVIGFVSNVPSIAAETHSLC
jgi:hypothetical protein